MLLSYTVLQSGHILALGIYRIIHKSLRDFRPLRYSSRVGHAEEEHVNRWRDTPSFCPTLQVFDMSTLGDDADVNPVIKSLPQTCNVCGRDLITGLTCLVTKGGHIEHLYGRTETWSLSPSVDTLPFDVTIPATLPQRSDIPEVLMNYPVYHRNFMYEKVMEFWSKSPYVQKPLGKRDRWDGNVIMDFK